MGRLPGRSIPGLSPSGYHPRLAEPASAWALQAFQAGGPYPQPEEAIMAKPGTGGGGGSGGGSKGGGGKGGGTSGGGGGGSGGGGGAGWPAKQTGHKSGSGRDNAPPKKP
jgi:hypothetical protein